MNPSGRLRDRLLLAFGGVFTALVLCSVVMAAWTTARSLSEAARRDLRQAWGRLERHRDVERAFHIALGGRLADDGLLHEMRASELAYRGRPEHAAYLTTLRDEVQVRFAETSRADLWLLANSQDDRTVVDIRVEATGLLNRGYADPDPQPLEVLPASPASMHLRESLEPVTAFWSYDRGIYLATFVPLIRGDAMEGVAVLGQRLDTPAAAARIADVCDVSAMVLTSEGSVKAGAFSDGRPLQVSSLPGDGEVRLDGRSFLVATH
ncbi:MAG: hypothetical protein AB1758_33060, partial [Candidatus Eremiobacterota bacterium]